jgi:ribonuclease VapC
MTTTRVFDSSALLALIFDEPGAAKAEALLHDGDAVVSAANVAEVTAKLIDQGLSDDEARAVHEGLALRVEPLTEAIALTAGRLRRRTKALGLSLGDRCCLAHAEALDASVVTADRPWKALKGFRFEFIR